MSRLDEAYAKLESVEARVTALEVVAGEQGARVEEFVARVGTLDERVEALESFFLPVDTVPPVSTDVPETDAPVVSEPTATAPTEETPASDTVS